VTKNHLKFKVKARNASGLAQFKENVLKPGLINLVKLKQPE
jgi:hypothetical protein